MNGRRILALTAFASVLAALGDRSAPEPTPPADGPPEGYHDHLDRCAQCRNNPFGLCAVGARAIEAEALRIETGPTPFRADPVWNAFSALPSASPPERTPEQIAKHDRGMAEVARGDFVPPQVIAAHLEGLRRKEALNAAESKRARRRARWAARKGST